MVSYLEDATGPQVAQAMLAEVGLPSPAMEAARAALV